MRKLDAAWLGLCAGVCVGVVAGCGLAQPGGEPGPYREKYRPQFHFTPVKNWMNDPNGLVYFEGEWHLFYQYNPEGDQWGHMSWGHAISGDLVHWEHLAVAIPERLGGRGADGQDMKAEMVFSGSAVVDAGNTSGFGVGGKVPLVAIYTGHRDGNESQCLAYSVDRGRTWKRYEKNPVIDIGLSDFRDPKVFWDARPEDGRGAWVMVVAVPNERKVRFYGSGDLKKWEVRGEFGPAGSTAGVWECPDLFPLAVEGKGQKKWVLIANVSGGAPAGGNGTQYFVGEFDGRAFVPEGCEGGNGVGVKWLDYGRDFYAAVTWSGGPAGDDRRILLAWMVSGEYAGAVPTHPWRSGMTVPRELMLREVAGESRIVQRPVRELERLRDVHWDVGSASGDSIAAVNSRMREKKVEGELLEIRAEFKVDEKGGAGAGGKFGIKVRAGKDEGTVIGYDRAEGRLFVDRTRAGESRFSRGFPGVHGAEMKVVDGVVKMDVWADRSSVEVFGGGGGGEVSITDLVFPDAGSRGVEVWGEGEGVVVRRMEVWTLKSAW